MSDGHAYRRTTAPDAAPPLAFVAVPVAMSGLADDPVVPVAADAGSVSEAAKTRDDPRAANDRTS